MKNILKKFSVLFSLIIILFGYNFVFAEDLTPPEDTISPVITLLGDISISLSVDSVYVDDGVTVLDNIDGDITLSVVKGGTFIDTSTVGTYTIIYTSTDKANNISTITRTVNVVSPTTVAKNENIIIRNGDSVIYSGVFDLPNSGNIDISGHNVDAQSVLGVLYSLDQVDDSFSISDISYNDSYQSHILNCITPKDSSPECYYWQYVVNGEYPYVGMDKNILKGGENIYLFFGQPNKILLSSSSINTSESLTVSSKKYDYENNTWLIRPGVIIGLVQTNPDNIYNPIEIQTGLVDENGQIVFSSLSEGLFGVGVKDDFYWPLENFEVTKTSPEGVSGGGGATPLPVVFDVSNAISYLSSVQDSGGSFGNSSLYTDWAAIAISAYNNSNLKSSILNYLKTNPVESSFVTDYERRAMALMSLGINPYSGTSVNYIEKIIDSFDGVQFGDSSLINDDVFALVVLKSASYSGNDEIITKDINYIISKQSNGSWGSIDMTAAAIQALYPFKSISGVSQAISNASIYLEGAQESNGGWGNISSSSWVAQAMNLLGKTWIKNDKTVYDYFGSQQAIDGAAVSLSETIENRIWETSYVIPAVLKLSWNDILNDFDKPIINHSDLDSSADSSTKEVKEIIKEEEQIDATPLEAIAPKINIDLAQKLKEKKIIKPEVVLSKPTKNITSLETTTEIVANNNLTASSGNAINTNFSIKEVSQNIINFVANFFHYVGNVFNNLLSLMHVF